MSQQSLSTAADREFRFSDEDFEEIRSLVRKYCGISLAESKRALVYGRLSKRLRATGLRSFSEYRSLLSRPDSGEFENFANALTTNLTSFYRESHHFDFFESTILPDILENRAASRRVRLWSAGCSTGEEPYSIAISVLERCRHVAAWDVKILATDLDTNCLEVARRGRYTARQIEAVDPERRQRWFSDDGPGDAALVSRDLRRLIAFKPLNLMAEWPMHGPFDAIFCRNVVIYFDKSTQRGLFERFSELIEPGGYLIVGHSESLHGLTDRFELIERTIYRRL